MHDTKIIIVWIPTFQVIYFPTKIELWHMRPRHTGLSVHHFQNMLDFLFQRVLICLLLQASADTNPASIKQNDKSTDLVEGRVAATRRRGGKWRCRKSSSVAPIIVHFAPRLFTG